MDQDDELVLRAALGALDAALSRHEADRARIAGRPSGDDLRAPFGSLVECTFWVATLDTWLFERYRGGYTDKRDAHRYGGDVRAMLWARDRHYHQLPFSTEHDNTPFFPLDRSNPTPNAMFYISAGLVWRNADALVGKNQDDRSHRKQARYRPDYERRAAGQPTHAPVRRAVRVFRALAESTDMLPT